MKDYLLILVLFLMLPFYGCSQKYKLVERSPKNKPKWMVEGQQRGHFLVSAHKMATLEDAQNSVMTTLLSQMASSVSVIVKGETVNKIDWTVVDLGGKTKEEYVQVVENSITTRIAKLPALQGVSLIKADVYWESYIDKKTKEICYDYYIHYPFSEFDLQELIEAYNAQEKALDDKIESYREALDELDNVDDMMENMAQLKSMMEEMKDDYRYGTLKVISGLYDSTIKDIYVEVLENYNDDDNGALVIQLKLDEKVMKTKSLPQLRSSCARDFNRKHDGNKMVLTFNTFDCYERDENYVEVRFTFGKRKLIKKINVF